MRYFHVVGRELVPVGPGLAAVAGGSVVDTAERVLLSAAVVKGCRVALGVTMALMLVIMI